MAVAESSACRDVLQRRGDAFVDDQRVARGERLVHQLTEAGDHAEVVRLGAGHTLVAQELEADRYMADGLDVVAGQQSVDL